LNREKILENFYKDGYISTPYNRKIAVQEEKAVNYMIQSTTSDLFMKQVMKVHDFLKDKKSFIAFLIHDSLVIDFDKSELDHINRIRQIFPQTIFGDFRSSIRIGKNYGDMKEWKL